MSSLSPASHIPALTLLGEARLCSVSWKPSPPQDMPSSLHPLPHVTCPLPCFTLRPSQTLLVGQRWTQVQALGFSYTYHPPFLHVAVRNGPARSYVCGVSPSPRLSGSAAGAVCCVSRPLPIDRSDTRCPTRAHGVGRRRRSEMHVGAGVISDLFVRAESRV